MSWSTFIQRQLHIHKTGESASSYHHPDSALERTRLSRVIPEAGHQHPTLLNKIQMATILDLTLAVCRNLQTKLPADQMKSIIARFFALSTTKIFSKEATLLHVTCRGKK